MFVTLILLKPYRECFSLVCFCWLFVLAGIQPGVVLATPAFCKLWSLCQCSFQSICSAILSASYERDPEGNLLCYQSSVLKAFAMLSLVISMHVQLIGESGNSYTDLGTFSLCHLSLHDFSLFSNP